MLRTSFRTILLCPDTKINSNQFFLFVKTKKERHLLWFLPTAAIPTLRLNVCVCLLKNIVKIDFRAISKCIGQLDWERQYEFVTNGKNDVKILAEAVKVKVRDFKFIVINPSLEGREAESDHFQEALRTDFYFQNFTLKFFFEQNGNINQIESTFRYTKKILSTVIYSEVIIMIHFIHFFFCFSFTIVLLQNITKENKKKKKTEDGTQKDIVILNVIELVRLVFRGEQ